MSDIESTALDETLPERESVGIALSGGGIRAAAFSMGVLEELHRAQGILRGPNAADWMSAVSGGSYTAGMVALLNSGSRARYSTDEPAQEPMPEGGSPLPRKAVDHVLAHSRYLVDDGAGRLIARLVFLLASGLASVLVLLAWIGTMLVGDLGAIGLMMADSTGWEDLWQGIPPLVQWAISLAALATFILIVSPSFHFGPQQSGAGTQPVRRRWGNFVLSLLGLVLVIATMPVLIYRIKTDLPWLASPSGLAEYWVPVLVVTGLAIIIAAVLAALGPRVRILGAVGAILTWLLLRLIPLAIVVLLIIWVGVWMFDLLTATIFQTDESTGWWGLAAFFGVLVAGVLVLPLPGLISPHRTYREMIARCFALRWTSEGNVERMPDADAVTLSSLRHADDGVRIPELIISAAANVTDVGAAPAGANVLPLEITGSTVSIPGKDGAELSTQDLEHMLAPKTGFGIVRSRPMLGLSSAVAITGAAVSPAMGRLTNPGLRPLLAAFNIRLGAWLPNPLWEPAREAARNRQAEKFSVGIDQLLWEMVGRHSAQAMVLYASDGGHYENLALMPLLRRRCRTVWAIDASPDRQGKCAGLGESIRLAREELDCEIDLDFAPFGERDAKGDPSTIFGVGTIRYDDGSTGVLHVIRLGVTAGHGSDLRQYRDQDPSFPYHSTIYQVFKANRVSSYRSLGLKSARLALAELARNAKVPNE
ncbi:MAG: hypothetical protein ABWX92_05210 [Mycetocola sp.]